MNWSLTVKSIRLHPIALPLVRPFKTSFGLQHLKGGMLVRLETDSGMIGWGEVTAEWSAGYSYETTQTAHHILRDFLIPNLLQVGTLTSDTDWAWLEKVRGHPMAKHALLSAIFSAIAMQQGVSMADFVQQMSGESTQQTAVKVGVSIGIEPTIDDTLKVVQEHVDEGYQRVKLKIKPNWDIEMLREVRRTFPDLLIMADANSAYTLDDVPLFKQMDDLNLLMIEQPLGYEDIYEHSLLQKQISTPLCLDESLHTLGHVQLAEHLGACKIVNLKPQRVGGLMESIAIHRFCKETGLGLWIGGMLESGIGRAMSMAIASLPHVTYPCDLSATNRYYNPDIAEPYFELNTETSTVDVPNRIGLGVEIMPDELNRAEAAYQTELSRLFG